MGQQKGFALWIRAWLLPFMSIAMLGGVAIQTIQRWQILHGTAASAIIHQKLGKKGAGSSGRYYLRARYVQPQGNVSYTRITTDRSTHHDLSLGGPVQVRYVHDPQNALLASEWSFTIKSLVIILVGLMLLFDGLSANQTWRNRRRDGYLPD